MYSHWHPQIGHLVPQLKGVGRGVLQNLPLKINYLFGEKTKPIQNIHSFFIFFIFFVCTYVCFIFVYTKEQLLVQGFADLDQNPKENGELADFSLFFFCSGEEDTAMPMIQKEMTKKHQVLISHVKYLFCVTFPIQNRWEDIR